MSVVLQMLHRSYWGPVLALGNQHLLSLLPDLPKLDFAVTASSQDRVTINGTTEGAHSLLAFARKCNLSHSAHLGKGATSQPMSIVNQVH